MLLTLVTEHEGQDLNDSSPATWPSLTIKPRVKVADGAMVMGRPGTSGGVSKGIGHRGLQDRSTSQLGLTGDIRLKQGTVASVLRDRSTLSTADEPAVSTEVDV